MNRTPPAALLLALLAVPLTAPAASPVLNGVTPRGAQPGIDAAGEAVVVAQLDQAHVAGGAARPPPAPFQNYTPPPNDLGPPSSGFALAG